MNFVGIQTARYAFENNNVKEFMRQQDLKFDLVIVEVFTHESWLMFGHRFKAPIVGISNIRVIKKKIFFSI